MADSSITINYGGVTQALKEKYKDNKFTREQWNATIYELAEIDKNRKDSEKIFLHGKKNTVDPNNKNWNTNMVVKPRQEITFTAAEMNALLKAMGVEEKDKSPAPAGQASAPAATSAPSGESLPARPAAPPAVTPIQTSGNTSTPAPAAASTSTPASTPVPGTTSAPDATTTSTPAPAASATPAATSTPAPSATTEEAQGNWFTNWLNDKDKVSTDGHDDGHISFSEVAESFGKGLIGIAKDAINHPIATAAIIGAGVALTLATGGAALVPLIAIGAAVGAGQIGYGTYKAATATTDGEAKQAYETIGNGVFALGTSAFGARSALSAAANAGVKSAEGAADLSRIGALRTCLRPTVLRESLSVSKTNIAAKASSLLRLSPAEAAADEAAALEQGVAPAEETLELDPEEESVAAPARELTETETTQAEQRKLLDILESFRSSKANANEIVLGPSAPAAESVAATEESAVLETAEELRPTEIEGHGAAPDIIETIDGNEIKWSEHNGEIFTKKTVTHSDGTVEVCTDLDKELNLYTKKTVTYPDGVIEEYTDFDKEGQKYGRNTVIYPSGKVEKYTNSSSNKGGDCFTDLTVTYPNGKVRNLKLRNIFGIKFYL